MAQPLAQQEPDAPRRRVHKHAVAGPDAEQPPHEELGGEPLQQHSRGGRVVDCVRHRHEAQHQHAPQAAVGPRRDTPHVHDPGPWQEPIDAVADRLDDANPFAADAARQRRQRVEPGAVVAVEEVDSDRAVPHDDLATRRCRHGQVLDTKLFGAAGRMDADAWVVHGR